VLGVDPGLVATGYGVLERAGSGSVVLAAGVVSTTADLALAARLSIIYDGVRDVLVKHAPDLLVIEDLYTEYKFPRTALLMAHARGVVVLAAGQCGVPVMALAPAEVKRAVAFHGAASKALVQHAIARLLNLTEPPHPSHVADALALAWIGLSRSGRAPARAGGTGAGGTGAGGTGAGGTGAGGRSPGAREFK
jgi:crossover junction endodeoxyribonuclease RuvC